MDPVSEICIGMADVHNKLFLERMEETVSVQKVSRAYRKLPNTVYLSHSVKRASQRHPGKNRNGY